MYFVKNAFVIPLNIIGGMALSKPEGVGELLVDVGEKVKNDPLDKAMELRKLVSEMRIVAKNSNNLHINFQYYFLSTIINDIWKNIAMSVSQEVDEDKQSEVLELLGEHLEDIGEKTRESNFEKCYVEYTFLLDEYLNKIDNIEVKQ